MKKNILYLALLFFALACSRPQTNHEKTVATIDNEHPKNIILMIGDGIGVAQLYTAYAAKKDNLNIKRCPVAGLVNTSSADDLITDSAAAGTAMATGEKTNNGHIGVDQNGNALKSILEIAEEKGKATGLIATSAITHATPASFIAHHPDRHEYEALALDFLKTDIDVIIGGGKKYFTDREDGLNLIDSLQTNNYSLVFNMNEMQEFKGDKIAAFIFEEHGPKVFEGREHYLEKASAGAIEILKKDEDGFFLMIEGSQIDWGGHDQDLRYVTEESIDFDEAVGKVLDFAEQNGETLVIVTSDHETGGLTITGGDLNSGKIEGHFSTDHHTPVFVPLFAYGPGAENFGGLYENTEIFDKMMKAFGWKIDY